jgi:hypothetical protein
MFDHNNIGNPYRQKGTCPGASLRCATRLICGALAFAAVASMPRIAMADEGGVSFWLPGNFGSLAAVPQQPGWSLATVYYHTSLSAGGDLSLSREFTVRRIPANLTANLNANLNATGDLALVVPSYVFATPVLGGQAAISMASIYGRTSTSLAGTLSGSLATPLGSIAFMRSDSFSDSVTGFGDLYPQATLKWNQGLYNFMTYLTGDIPVGAYDSTRLSNIGIGHGALDGGGGYTYFNPQTGRELSAVTGLTYNFTNQSTDYRNGVDWHLDWGASQFLSEQVHVGGVGYFFQQLSGDSGGRLGDFKSRVIGIGPQIGFIFPVGNMQGYLNFKGYKEFDEEHRAAGWNGWVTFVISPAAPTPPPPKTPLIHK